MRIIGWTIAVAIALGGVAAFERTCGDSAMAQEHVCTADCCAAESKSDDAAIACTITDPDLMAVRRAETARLFNAAIERVETERGYKLKFDRSLAQDLFDYARFESDCCAFIEFTLTFKRNNGPVWLELSGSEEAKAVIREMLPRNG